MVVRITFDTDNDAFVGRRKEEVCKVLRRIIKGIKQMDHINFGGFSVRDVNGNRLGSCDFAAE